MRPKDPAWRMAIQAHRRLTRPAADDLEHLSTWTDHLAERQAALANTWRRIGRAANRGWHLAAGRLREQLPLEARRIEAAAAELARMLDERVAATRRRRPQCGRRRDRPHPVGYLAGPAAARTGVRGGRDPPARARRRRPHARDHARRHLARPVRDLPPRQPPVRPGRRVVLRVRRPGPAPRLGRRRGHPPARQVRGRCAPGTRSSRSRRRCGAGGWPTRSCSWPPSCGNTTPAAPT